MCLYATQIKNRKYLANKKNGGVIPVMKDKRAEWVQVGCGRCIECRKQKASAWQVRLLEDIKEHKNGKFVTLTFSDKAIKEIKERVEKEYSIEGYELDNQIATKAMRLFLERWRKKYKKSLRHWFVTELGHEGTENIHMHGIIWTDMPLEEATKEVRKIWNYGHVWMGQEKNGKIINYVNEATVNYSIKYVSQADEKHKYYNSIVLTSPGIGKSYTEGHDVRLNKFKGEETVTTYRTRTGHKIAMPTYWRNKIYDEEQREILWMKKLDKDEKWICGEKVKASDEQACWELTKWHRKKNILLGYGSDEKDWRRVEFEKQRRKIMMEKRLEKVKDTLPEPSKIKYEPKEKEPTALEKLSQTKLSPNTSGRRNGKLLALAQT